MPLICSGRSFKRGKLITSGLTTLRPTSLWNISSNIIWQICLYRVLLLFIGLCIFLVGLMGGAIQWIAFSKPVLCHCLGQGSATLGTRATTGMGQHNHWHTKKRSISLFYLIIIIKIIHSTMRQHNHYYRLFLHFILFWAFPPRANMFKLVTESSVLKWDQLIVFKPML